MRGTATTTTSVEHRHRLDLWPRRPRTTLGVTQTSTTEPWRTVAGRSSDGDADRHLHQVRAGSSANAARGQQLAGGDRPVQGRAVRAGRRRRRGSRRRSPRRGTGPGGARGRPSSTRRAGRQVARPPPTPPTVSSAAASSRAPSTTDAGHQHDAQQEPRVAPPGSVGCACARGAAPVSVRWAVSVIGVSFPQVSVHRQRVSTVRNRTRTVAEWPL